MAKAKIEKLEKSKVLSFEGKIVPSDAIMMSGNMDSDNWSYIDITEKTVRGVMSNRLKSSDDKKATHANIQHIDSASLHHDHDCLKVSFTLKILSGCNTPSACESPAYEKKLKTLINGYIEEHGFKELSKRYAQNIINARYLWRNRFGAESVTVKINTKGKELVFNAFDYSLNNFDEKLTGSALTLANIIEEGLLNNVTMEVTAIAKIGKGMPVYPSQKMIMNIASGSKGRHLFSVDNVTAGLHSQKVGNALRTIDTWHEKFEEIGAVAINPYASVTQKGQANRPPSSKNDFYSIWDAWIMKDVEPTIEQKHYVVAMLILGGVFGG